MAKVRLHPLTQKEDDFDQVEGETLQELFDRFYKQLDTGTDKLQEYFEIHVDGCKIDREFWPYTRPNPGTKVLIAMVPKGGDLGGILASVAVIVALAVVAPYTAGLAYGWAINAAVAVGTSLLVNALIPPPDAPTGPTLAGPDSQMYTINNQKNKLKKFGIVPKVYGRHRMFPTIAAAPYTTIEVDEKGELVQFFYAVYDFGLGPLNVERPKIGNTPIDEYSEAYYRLVDFNKPDTNEGPWDDALLKTLTWYSGDVNQESIGVAINGNQIEPGTPLEDYQVTRFADDSADGSNQEITAVFTFPSGFTTVAPNGSRAARNIEAQIEWAEVGTEDWKAFNNTDDNFSWTTTGDVNPETSSVIPVPIFLKPDFNRRYYTNYAIIQERELTWQEAQAQTSSSFVPDFGSGYIAFYEDAYGYKAGSNIFYGDKFLNIGVAVSYGGKILGKILTRTLLSGNTYQYTLDTPYDSDIILFRAYIRQYNIFGNDVWQSYWDWIGQSEPIIGGSFIADSTSGLVTFSGNSQRAVYAQIKFKPRNTNQIKVRITRIRSYGGHSFQVFDDMSWQTLTTRFDREPIKTTKRHTFIEVKIKATDQLNGSLDNINSVVTSVLDVYDDVLQTWSKQATVNPAWIFADLLTGEVNKNAIAKTRLDTSSLITWKDFCEEVPAPPPSQSFEKQRFECNFVLDFDTTLATILNRVCNAAQASLTLNNGLYGVLVDKLVTVPVQIFTPRNSWDFKSIRNYTPLPDAMRVKYIDSYTDWSQKEVIVYSDGFDFTTATKFEDFETFAVTNFEQAWRYGRYNLAQAKLRQENITINVDFEHLVCTRGDYVKLQHDVMKVGGKPARIKTVNTMTNRVTIDDAFQSIPMASYAYTFRNENGIDGGTMIIIDSDTAELTGPLPTVGDLFVWGEVDSVTIDCIVKSIVPNEDLTAQLTLVEKADAIHSAESTDTLPGYDPQFSRVQDDELTAPSEVQNLDTDDNTWRCSGGGYEYYIGINWIAPEQGIVDKYEVYIDNGSGFELVGFTSNLVFEYIVPEDDLNVQHNIKVLGVSSTGNKISLGEVTATNATPLLKTEKPSGVDALYINITNETLQLDWDLIEDCDVDEYLIRFSPDKNSTWESSIPLQRADSRTSQVTVQGRTGKYFIKAVDWNGNESANAALAITSIPELTNLNIIEETNDFPTLPGATDRVTKPGSALILQEAQTLPSIEYHTEGYYYFEEFLDLGEIYTVRLSSLITAEGYTVDDLMSSWVTLASVATLATVRNSEWSVEAQYRATDQFNIMANWPDLVSIDPISEGIQDKWTEWRKFTIGDFTGRIFQFRLKLISNKASVSPRVLDGIIRSDMPDRIEEGNNIIAPAIGLAISYAPEFKGPGTSPAVQISQDNASQGDYYQLTNKTLAGFTINFYDKNNNPVSRQFDYMVKGYGRKQLQVI